MNVDIRYNITIINNKSIKSTLSKTSIYTLISPATVKGISSNKIITTKFIKNHSYLLSKFNIVEPIVNINIVNFYVINNLKVNIHLRTNVIGPRTSTLLRLKDRSI